MTPRKDCQHPILNFESGDYYLSCSKCGAKWATIGEQPEYGKDKDGHQIGANPALANQGPSPSISARVVTMLGTPSTV